MPFAAVPRYGAVKATRRERLSVADLVIALGNADEVEVAGRIR